MNTVKRLSIKNLSYKPKDLERLHKIMESFVIPYNNSSLFFHSLIAVFPLFLENSLYTSACGQNTSSLVDTDSVQRSLYIKTDKIMTHVPRFLIQWIPERFLSQAYEIVEHSVFYYENKTVDWTVESWNPPRFYQTVGRTMVTEDPNNRSQILVHVSMNLSIFSKEVAKYWKAPGWIRNPLLGMFEKRVPPLVCHHMEILYHEFVKFLISMEPKSIESSFK